MDTYPTNAGDAYQNKYASMGDRAGDSGVFFLQDDRFDITPGTGLAVEVGPGTCAIEAIHGVETGTTTVTLDPAHASLGRNDYIVASLHKDDPDEEGDPYEIVIEKITGTPSSSTPLPLPALRNSATRVDIPLGYVYVGPTASSLVQNDIHMARQWNPHEALAWRDYSPSVHAIDTNNTGSGWLAPQYNPVSTDVSRYMYSGGKVHVQLHRRVRHTTGSGYEYGISVPFPARQTTVGHGIVQNIVGYGALIPNSALIGGDETDVLQTIAMRQYTNANLTVGGGGSQGFNDQINIVYEVAS